MKTNTAAHMPFWADQEWQWQRQRGTATGLSPYHRFSLWSPQWTWVPTGRPAHGGSEARPVLADIWWPLRCPLKRSIPAPAYESVAKQYSCHAAFVSATQPTHLMYSWGVLTLLVRYLTGLLPPPHPHTLSSLTMPWFILSNKSALSRAFLQPWSLLTSTLLLCHISMDIYRIIQGNWQGKRAFHFAFVSLDKLWGQAVISHRSGNKHA